MLEVVLTGWAVVWETKRLGPANESTTCNDCHLAAPDIGSGGSFFSFGWANADGFRQPTV